MCKYCECITNTNYAGRHFGADIYAPSYGDWVMNVAWGGSNPPSLYLMSSDEAMDVNVEVYCCPMCGRKLNGDANE